MKKKSKHLAIISIVLMIFLFCGNELSVKAQGDPVDIYGEGDSDTIGLNLFNVGAWGKVDEVGPLALMGLVAQFTFALLVVSWVFLVFVGTIRIIRSKGQPEGIQMGTKRIMNILYGITFGIMFFIAVSFIGTFSGAGNIFEWSDNLQNCDCSKASGGADCYTYLFQAKASEEDGDSLAWTCTEGSGWRH